MVVAQLIKRLHPTPEIRGSIPIIGKFYPPIAQLKAEKDQKKKKKQKRPGIFKKNANVKPSKFKDLLTT